MKLKTDWKMNDIIKPKDFNDIGEAVNGLGEELANKADLDKTLDWTKVSLENGFEHFSETIGEDLVYSKSSLGLVTISGVFKRSTSLNQDVICTLPRGFRPNRNLFVPVNSVYGQNQQTFSAYVSISPDGNVRFPSQVSSASTYQPGAAIAINCVYVAIE